MKVGATRHKSEGVFDRAQGLFVLAGKRERQRGRGPCFGELWRELDRAITSRDRAARVLSPISRQRQTHLDVRPLRRQFRRPVETPRSFGEVGPVHHHHAEVDPGIDTVGIALDRSAKMTFGLVKSSQAAQHLAEVGQVNRGRRDGNRAFDERDSFRRLSELKANQAQQVQRIGIPRLQGEDLTIERLCLLKPTGLMVRDSL